MSFNILSQYASRLSHNLVKNMCFMQQIPKLFYSVFSPNPLAMPKMLIPNSVYCSNRGYTSKPTEGEVAIINILRTKFPLAKEVNVTDISGGCGEMYEIEVESVEFKGIRTLQQHKLVTQALKAEVPKMHGLRIFTSLPEET